MRATVNRHFCRRLDAASHFAGQRFTEVRYMTGGIEAWVDPAVPRYEFAPEFLGGAAIPPLSSAVSEAERHQSSQGAS